MSPMNLFKFSQILFILSLPLLSGCASESKNSVAGEKWYSNMHKLSVNHSALIPIAGNQKAFYDPRNYEKIKSHSQSILETAVQLTKDSEAPNSDPLITATAKQFASATNAIVANLESGNMQSANYGINQLSTYCISCHTRADRGSQDFTTSWKPQLSALNSLQKANYYLANRLYTSAHKEVDSIVNDSALAQVDPAGWFAVVQKDLAVRVRVQNDLKSAKSLVDMALKNKSLPYYMLYDVQAWQRSISEWQKESAAEILTLVKVKSLLTQATRPPYSQGDAGLILYLRASRILHTLLENSKSPSYADAHYYAGITAEGLKKVDLSSLSEKYYQGCIEASPATILSEKCYARLEWVMQQSHPYMDTMPETAKVVSGILNKYKTLAMRERKESVIQNRYDSLFEQ